MKPLIVDFHVHSHFSRATAKNLDLENIYIAAQLKGITLVGTGDFTHPGWFSEIKSKLAPDENGLFKLKDDLAANCDEYVPDACRGLVRFVLVSEISNIYKKDGQTRKNHNLVLAPNLEAAAALNARLDKIGNVHSDGRPILGLDARDLLEIVLETSEAAALIPAHIWTPWFSLLGSKSGFDSLAHCFEDLTPHIFAVETGLSSDPAMNWRLSQLDGISLVSNSDAHSPANLGREANLFHTVLSYPAVMEALRTGDPDVFRGTLEFYPEEGKYHLDGHRKCGVSLWPQETLKQDGQCPVCGKSLTLGVLYRVEALADRPEGRRSPNALPYHSLIPLCEILAEILKVGPKSLRVQKMYRHLLNVLGPEIHILHELEIERIRAAEVPLLAEAIDKMRRQAVEITPGFDGEFGRIRLFTPEERAQLSRQPALFTLTPPAPLSEKRPVQPAAFEKTAAALIQVTRAESIRNPQTIEAGPVFQATDPENFLRELNREQRAAVVHAGSPLLIVAGPGTGKTRTLTQRIAYLVQHRAISPGNILAVTFTHKAGQEMRDRLARLLLDGMPLPQVGTFHSLCFQILTASENGLCPDGPPTVVDDLDRETIMDDGLKMIADSGVCLDLKSAAALKKIVEAKQRLLGPEDDLAPITEGSRILSLRKIYTLYQELLAIQGLCDFEDLILIVVKALETDPVLRDRYQRRFRHLFVDEYQDLNEGQYRLIRALAPDGKNLCVIGDPDQSIYAFRGSDTLFFQKFKNDYPQAQAIHLAQNYRSTEAILEASFQVIQGGGNDRARVRTYSGINGVSVLRILELPSDRAEAVAVGKAIERFVGGTGFQAVDFGKLDGVEAAPQRSFADFAVLYRTTAQGALLAEVLEKAGIPCQVASRQRLFETAGVRELLALWRIIEGKGTYADLDRIRRLGPVGIGVKVFEALKRWGLSKKFSLREALVHARRFPIRGLRPRGQLALSDRLKHLDRLESRLAGMTLVQKLLCLMEEPLLAAVIAANPDTDEPLARLNAIARQCGSSAPDFFKAVALHTDIDTYDSRCEKVALMTMHAAKGLEFSVVFITGCEMDYIPFKRSGAHTADVAEERRLFYVAMTRAKEELVLTYTRKRFLYGKSVDRVISPFVSDIEDRLKTLTRTCAKKQSGSRQAQLKLFG